MDYSKLSDDDIKKIYHDKKKEINQLHNGQMTIKILMNSLYGAIANKYFNYFIGPIAEAITHSGQLSVKWAEKTINNYLNKTLKTDNVDYITYIDTDSVVGDTYIYINGSKIKIKDYFDSLDDNFIKYDNFNEDYIKKVEKDVSLSFSSDKKIEEKSVKYVMKHKVKKEMFEIYANDKSVIVTEDHSIIVEEKNTSKIISISPKHINPKNHRIISVHNNELNFTRKFEIKSLGIQEEYVYDIEVEDNHNFFANDILVHNSNYINCEPLVKMVFGMSEIKSDNPDDIKDFHQKVENFLDHVFKEKIDPEIEKGYKELGSILNVYEDHHLVMKREKINSLSLFVGKKKYILNTLNSEGVHFNTPKISVTGIESVRSSTPEVCRNKMKDLFSIIMSNDESKAQEFINEFWEEFRQLPPEEIAKNSGTGDLNLYIDKKNIYTKSCPIHFRGALLYNEFLKKKGLEKIYPEIISGDKIKFVYLKMPNPIRENVISFQEKIPDEFNLKDYIDYETQFEKVFVKPIQNIFDAVSWTTEKIDTLEDFFS